MATTEKMNNNVHIILIIRNELLLTPPSFGTFFDDTNLLIKSLIKLGNMRSIYIAINFRLLERLLCLKIFLLLFLYFYTIILSSTTVKIYRYPVCISHQPIYILFHFRSALSYYII